MKKLELPKGFEEHMKKPAHPKGMKEHKPHEGKMPTMEKEAVEPAPPSGRFAKQFHHGHGRRPNPRGM